MYSKSFSALLSALRLLLTNRRAVVLIVTAYAGLLAALYLFVTTREATISQLLVTFFSIAAAPALFFVLQSVSVTHAAGGLRKVAIDSLKLLIVSVPVIALTVFVAQTLSKLETHLTIATTLRYLLVAVVAPLLAIQLWIVTSTTGLRSLAKSLRTVISRTLAPHSVFAYACGFLIFALAPYLLLRTTIATERAWLEFSFLAVRLVASATLMLVGWTTTVGAISILSRDE
ncbi:MAG TPA: hypothetical protein VGD61_12200 [Pyrinomonadaceae bacterium]